MLKDHNAVTPVTKLAKLSLCREAKRTAYFYVTALLRVVLVHIALLNNAKSIIQVVQCIVALLCHHI